jgi:hypothetical protein
MIKQCGLCDPLFDPPEADIEYASDFPLNVHVTCNWFSSSTVFVHGLDGDRVRTWTWESRDRSVLWPQDLLPQVCPRARILSFGYNADFAHFYPFYGPKFISEQLTIDDHATALFQSLVGLREKTRTVSIEAIMRETHADKMAMFRLNVLLFSSRTAWAV